MAPDFAFQDLESLFIPSTQLKVEEKLGEGGFGEVYKAKYKEEKVAWKQIKSEKASAKLHDEFSTEVRFMTLLNHENIVSMRGLTIDPIGVVMELIECGDLYHLLHDDTFIMSRKFQVKVAHDIASGNDISLLL